MECTVLSRVPMNPSNSALRRERYRTFLSLYQAVLEGFCDLYRLTGDPGIRVMVIYLLASLHRAHTCIRDNPTSPEATKKPS